MDRRARLPASAASSGRDLAADFERRGQLEDRLRRALGDDRRRPSPSGASTTTDRRRRSKSNGISSTFAIARQIDRRPADRIAASSGLRMPVSNVLLMKASVKRPRRRASGRIDRAVELHHAARQRAGLVAAQDVDAAEVLNRRQVLDDHLLARHAQRALGQRDRADHRQELRRQADAERHGEEQRFERVVPERDAHQQDEQHQDDGRPAGSAG